MAERVSAVRNQKSKWKVENYVPLRRKKTLKAGRPEWVENREAGIYRQPDCAPASLNQVKITTS